MRLPWLERTGDPLHERAFFGEFGQGPILSNALGGKIALCVLHVLAAVDGFAGFPKRAASFSRAALAFWLGGEGDMHRRLFGVAGYARFAGEDF
jgi:hypothetical protein